MSDDTPTQRYDLGDDTPTERVETPDPTVPLQVQEERKSRKLIIILASIGGALLLALLILLIVLLTRGESGPVAPTPSATPSPTPSATASVTPSATPTPSSTPTPAPTPTATVAPPSTDAAVDSFTINPTTVDCSGGDSVVITIKWATSNANNVYFGVDTGGASAKDQPFFGDSLPASGTSTNDFPNGYRPFDYTCGNGSHTYAITAVGSDNTEDTVFVKVTE